MMVLCAPSFIVVGADAVTRGLSDDGISLTAWVAVGAAAMVFTLLAPLLTLAAGALTLSVTIWRREMSARIAIMWIVVILSVMATARIASILKRCCI